MEYNEYYIRKYFMPAVRKLRECINEVLNRTGECHLIMSSVYNTVYIIAGFALLNLRTHDFLRVGVSIFEMRYTT